MADKKPASQRLRAGGASRRLHAGGPGGVILLGVGGLVATVGLVGWAVRAGAPLAPLAGILVLLSVILSVLTGVAARQTHQARLARRALVRKSRALAVQTRLRALILEAVSRPLAITAPDGRPLISTPAYDALSAPLSEAVREVLETPLPLPDPDNASTDDLRTITWTEDGQSRRARLTRRPAGGGLLVVTLDPGPGPGPSPAPADPDSAPPPPSDLAVDVNQALANALEGLAERIRNTKADIRSSVLPAVLGSRETIEEILRGGVEAALDAAVPDRPLRIEIHGKVEEGHALLTLEDNGDGSGTGADALADERFGRFLSVKAKPGVGTTLVVTLPAAPPRSNAQRAAPL